MLGNIVAGLTVMLIRFRKGYVKKFMFFNGYLISNIELWNSPK